MHGCAKPWSKTKQNGPESRARFSTLFAWSESSIGYSGMWAFCAKTYFLSPCLSCLVSARMRGDSYTRANIPVAWSNIPPSSDSLREIREGPWAHEWKGALFIPKQDFVRATKAVLRPRHSIHTSIFCLKDTLLVWITCFWSEHATSVQQNEEKEEAVWKNVRESGKKSEEIDFLGGQKGCLAQFFFLAKFLNFWQEKHEQSFLHQHSSVFFNELLQFFFATTMPTTIL